MICFNICAAGHGQHLYMETGFSGASFKDFRDDQGISTLDNRFSRPKEFGFGSGILLNGHKEIVQLDIGFYFNTYKINTSFGNNGSTGIPLFYDLSFFSLKMGVYVKLMEVAKIKLRVHSHLSHGWLTHGSITYEDEFVDILREDRGFGKTIFNHHYGGSLVYPASDYISFFVSYDIRNSFKESTLSDETYRLHVQSFSVGLLSRITLLDKDSYKTLKEE